MNLHALNQAHADQIVTDGGGWVFGVGITPPREFRQLLTPRGYEGVYAWFAGDQRLCKVPPASFVEACQPCENYRHSVMMGLPRTPCPCGRNCHDGRRRCELVVPCDCGCHDTADMFAEWDCRCDDGLVTVATVVAVGEPLRVYREGEPLGADHGNWLELFGRSLIRYADHDQVELIASPPDVDPASLVGQWALQIKVVS